MADDIDGAVPASPDDPTRRWTLTGLLAAAAGGLGGTLAAATAFASPAAAAEQDGSALLLRGPGIDPTGARDSRAAVQALLDAAPAGATIVNPSGAVLRLDGGITVRRPNTRLAGAGEWRFRAGGAYSVDPAQQNGFIDLRADHCWLDGLHVTNPDGVLNRGVIFLADFGRITDCTLIGFGSGVHVSPAGEFHDFVITGNYVLDVIGNGGGPADTSTVGESYGDGIVCWGAAATIAHNVVTCRQGADARIGIHVEGLDDQARTPWRHDHRLVSITGNVIHGPFRRGIVSEGVHHVAITANAVADATWWSIALISADHCVVAGNTLRYTRTAADRQGSAWNPSRSAIMLYRVDDKTLADPVVVDNAIHVPEGAAADAAIRITGNALTPLAIEGGRIAGNRIRADGVLARGIEVDRPTVDLAVDGNRIAGFRTAGIDVGGHRGLKVRQNTVVGPGRATAAVGIRITGGSRLTADGNEVTGATTGIAATGQAVRTVVDGSLLEDLAVGIDLTGTTGAVRCVGISVVEVDTELRGQPAVGVTA